MGVLGNILWFQECGLKVNDCYQGPLEAILSKYFLVLERENTTIWTDTCSPELAVNKVIPHNQTLALALA